MNSLQLGIYFIFSCCVSSASAMISMDTPYILVSKDESRVLVMQKEVSKQDTLYYNEKIQLSSGVELRPMTDFQQSGVYSMPDKKLIYGINWYMRDQGVLPSADFEHIMCQNRHGANDTWALKFYTHGKEVKSYSTDELLTAFKSYRYLPFTASDYHHPWCRKMELIVNRAIVHTSDRKIWGFEIGYSEVYEFDLTTGEMRSKDVRNAGFIALVVALLGFLGILAALVARYLRSRRKKSMPN